MGFCMHHRISRMDNNPPFQWYRRYAAIVDDFEALEASFTQPLPTCLRTNPLKISTGRLAEIFYQEDISAEPIPGIPDGFQIGKGLERPGRHWAFWAGLYSVMETVSMLPVALLEPRPHERVLDLCAAPGSKTVQIGWAMENTGTLIANDRDRGRIQALRQALLRTGLVNASTTAYDGVNYPRAAGYFDRILVDAPCSCEGTIRKNPEVAGRLHYKKIRSLARIQTLLLEKAYQLCRTGGRIVYSTCTFAPEENELVVDAVLGKYGPEQIRLVPTELPDIETRPGITEWEGHPLHPSLGYAIRIWPHHNNTGGFFMAVLEKTGERRCPNTIEKMGRATRSPVRPDQRFQKTEAVRHWLGAISGRFGIRESDLNSHQFFSDKPGRISFAAKDHAMPEAPESLSTGLPLMRAHALYPKLSTAAAQLLGPLAEQNVVQLSRKQIESYMNRERVVLRPEQQIRITESGYVLVRYDTIALGIGFIRKTGNSSTNHMESLFPKAWFGSGGV